MKIKIAFNKNLFNNVRVNNSNNNNRLYLVLFLNNKMIVTNRMI